MSCWRFVPYWLFRLRLPLCPIIFLLLSLFIYSDSQEGHAGRVGGLLQESRIRSVCAEGHRAGLDQDWGKWSRDSLQSWRQSSCGQSGTFEFMCLLLFGYPEVAILDATSLTPPLTFRMLFVVAGLYRRLQITDGRGRTRSGAQSDHQRCQSAQQNVVSIEHPCVSCFFPFVWLVIAFFFFFRQPWWCCAERSGRQDYAQSDCGWVSSFFNIVFCILRSWCSLFCANEIAVLLRCTRSFSLCFIGAWTSRTRTWCPLCATASSRSPPKRYIRVG